MSEHGIDGGANGSAGITAAPDTADELRLGRREILLIVAFWTFIAVLTAANRMLDPRGNAVRMTLTSGPVVMAVVESALWALFTPLVFWAAARLTAPGTSRAWRMAGVVGLGLVLAIVVDTTSGAVRAALFPFPRRGPGGGPPSGPLPLFSLRHLWILNDLIVYVAVLATGIARAVSIRSRTQSARSARLESEASRLRAQLAEAQLDALRMQLDPHFLFNTLHAISSLVERDPRGVRRMISRLSDLLRHNIEGSTEQELSLREELDLLRRYLEIMEVRFQGRLDVSIVADERAQDALVPNLILQPIVENAVKHGVSRIEGPGRITIGARVEGDMVVIRVENNGPPPSTGTSATAGTGVGVRNTRARLAHLYGSAQSFSLRPSDSDPTGGTVAELRIPYHTRADLRAAAVGGAARRVGAGA